ncbi:DNA polymerase, partial [Paratractidigestivibacter sp.]|uniref:DNA polymerase n=1 Tax=Paratractidigestivibacter sp. TaxID=2847316 RepID=UPI002AC9BEE8
MTHRLHIDIETFCEADIAKCGVYRYASDPSFEILLIAYAFDDDPVKVIDLASGEEMPESFVLYLSDPALVKCAHNATFERVCFSNWLRRHGYLRPDEWLDPDQWFCTMVQASRCGLPMSLKDCGAALGLTEQKMSEGKDLIRVFCVAHKAKGSLVASTRVMPEDRPEDWATFKAYCLRDVEVERNIDRALAWNEPTAYEQHLYAVDQRINDHGVLIDLELARKASEADTLTKARLVREMRVLTGLDNPNSVSQLRGWLTEQGVDLSAGVDKKAIGDLAKSASSDTVRRVCACRLELGKTSLAKYSTMLDVACADHRARGLMQFYGARTGRWAGRLIQMQNLPQNHISTLDWARERLREGDIDSLELMYGNVPDTMSQLIRTAFIAPKGKTFAVCDFSAIEARVLAWLAGEDWVLDAFRRGKDIYCETASQMFGVPVEKHGRNAELRQKGKIAVLALGYGGGSGALDAMGGQRMGLTLEEEQEIV